jgi:hypothetical protein
MNAGAENAPLCAHTPALVYIATNELTHQLPFFLLLISSRMAIARI